MDKFILIEKYFEGTLSESEQKEFDDLLTNDVEFKKEFDFQQNLQQAIVQESRDTLKRELQALEKNSFQENKVKRLFPFLKVAASVVLIFSIGAYLLLNSNNSSEELFQEYYSPYTNVIQPIVRGEASENIEYQAFLNYESEKYQEALTLFETAYSETKNNHLLLYKANCLLSLNNPKKAILNLENYLKTSSAFKDKAYWYLGLSHLKLNDKSAAKEHFKKLEKLDSFKQKEVQEILKNF